MTINKAGWCEFTRLLVSRVSGNLYSMWGWGGTRIKIPREVHGGNFYETTEIGIAEATIRKGSPGKLSGHTSLLCFPLECWAPSVQTEQTDNSRI